MRFNILLFSALVMLFGFSVVGAQEKFDEKTTKEGQTEKPSPSQEKIDLKKGLTTGIQVGEFAILIYSNATGRPGLNQIRKTTVEIGKIQTTNADGSAVTSDYENRVVRSEDSLYKEKIRFYQKFPDAAYSLVYDGNKIFGLFDNAVFTPTEDAVRKFENRIWHGIEALLRYKENGSEIKLEKEETILGVQLYVVEVTDKQKRKTKFYVSKKSLRVMMLTYEDRGIKYRRKFYDHNIAQGTLVPYRSVLWAENKIVEEQDISTITFGQTLDDGIFEGAVANTR